MSRYSVNVKTIGASDANATIGYDRPLRTFFLTAFLDEEDDAPELWLGAFLEEYPTLESLLIEVRTRGFSISGLHHADMIAMMAEAGHAPSKRQPSA